MASEAQIFGDHIRQLREKRGLTQEKLAQVSDLTTSFVSTIERGAKSPSLNTILKLARGLKIDAADLLSDFGYDALRRMKL